VTLITYNDNVDKVRPGDRIEVVGIFRVTDCKVFKNRQVLKSIFNSHLDVISFGVIKDKNNLRIEDGQNGFTVYNDDDKDKFAQIADSPTVLSDLISSFAPSIFGN
jgi:DNA replication licensing factor MCM4